MAVKSTVKSVRSTKKASQTKSFRITKTHYDFGFLTTVMILLVLGLMMVFSASYPSAYYNYGSGYYFIKGSCFGLFLELLPW